MPLYLKVVQVPFHTVKQFGEKSSRLLSTICNKEMILEYSRVIYVWLEKTRAHRRAFV